MARNFINPILLITATTALISCGGGANGDSNSKSSLSSLSSISSSSNSNTWNHLVDIAAGSRRSGFSHNGELTLSDRFFTGGNAKQTSVTEDLSTTHYYSRQGEFSYHIPVTDGQYKITFKMAETEFTHAGQRTFSVTLEGQPTKILDFDLLANTEAFSTFSVALPPAQVTDGFIDLEFNSTTGGATLELIHIETIGGKLVETPPSASESTTENSGETCEITHYPQLSKKKLLPDPFQYLNGTRAQTKAQWSCVRQETLRAAEYYILGEKPYAPDELSAQIEDSSITISIKHQGKEATFTARLFVPENADHSTPILIHLPDYFTRRVPQPILDSGGMIVIDLNLEQISLFQPDEYAGVFYALYGIQHSAGHHMARAWATSRIIDALSLLSQQHQLAGNLDSIAVFGIGETANSALISGAFDQRIALTLALDPSSNTIGCWRHSSAQANVNLFNQFFINLLTIDRNLLPIDTHQLVGLIAPRPVAILTRTSSVSQNQQVLLSALATREIYKALGAEDRFTLETTNTERYYGTLYDDQNNVLSENVRRFLFNDFVTTGEIKTNPETDIDLEQWRQWNTPLLSD